jgi:hypothetical protein
MAWAPKDPNDRLDYVFDFTPELSVAGDTIDSVEIALDPVDGEDPPELVNGDGAYAPEIMLGGMKVRVWLSEGTDEISYPVTCRATVASGPPTRVYERTCILKVKNQKVA